MLLYHGLVPERQLENELMRTGEPRGFHHVLERRAGIRQCDVLPHGAAEHHVLLQHDADLPTQTRRINQ